MARNCTNMKKSRDTFYIVTNGEKTERNYFELLKSRKSIFKVKVIYNNADPFHLIEYARQYLDDANQVWCVFDVDASYSEGRLVPAIKLADKCGIKYAFSNIAFEVWLLSHFKQCNREMDCAMLNDELGSCLKDEANIDYDKTSRDLLEKFFVPNYRTAVQNSKVVYQTWMKNHKEKYGEDSRPPIWKWNSCTSVFRLVEALKLQK